MTPDRWQQIEKIYHSALELEDRQRVAFLEKACAGDEALRQEVESLLRSEDSGDRFIEEPALEAAVKMMAHKKPESLLGQQLGSYQILSLLGTELLLKRIDMGDVLSTFGLHFRWNRTRLLDGRNGRYRVTSRGLLC